MGIGLGSGDIAIDNNMAHLLRDLEATEKNSVRALVGFENSKNHGVSNSCLLEGVPPKQNGYCNVSNTTSLAISSCPPFLTSLTRNKFPSELPRNDFIRT